MARAYLMPDHVRVRVLGASEITVGARRVGMGTEALFAFALFVTTRAGERLTRAELLETFWPGGEEEARRHSLRQMLYRLRQKGFRFAEEGEHLLLDATLVDSDVRECLSPSWPESAGAEAVEAALTLGPTFSARLPSSFLEWFEGVRTTVSHQARKAAFRWISTSRTQGRWGEVERWSRAVVGVDPLNEEATLALAEAASMSGAKTLALEILDGYLVEVGGTDASAGKPAQVLRKRIAERRASWLPSGPREVALIGRAEEMSVLTQAIEATVSGQGRSVLVVGPSGYGKSRLLAEAREFAALRGVRCVGVRADASVAANPWALARDLCRELAGQPGAAATDPRSMEVLRALIREEGTRGAGIGLSVAITEDEIRRALVAVAAAISDEARTLITVDDLQNADEQSRSLLRVVMQDLDNSRCCLLATTHSGGQLLEGPRDGRLRVQSLRLTALTTADTKHLAHLTALGHGNALPQEALANIAQRSAGHPLFARELALSYLRGGEGGSLPATLTDVVARNLAAQSPEAMHVLRIVALLANAATIRRVLTISRQERGAFLSCIEALGADGVLQVDHQQVLRLHDSWRNAVLHKMPDALTAALALECAEVLSQDSDIGLHSTHGRIADLFGYAGELSRSIEHRLLYIDSMLAAGLYDSALEALRAEPAYSTTGETRARLRVRESVALLATARPLESHAIADEVWRSRALQTFTTAHEHLLAVGIAADCHVKLDGADSGPVAELLSLAKSETLAPQLVASACLWGVRLVSNAADHTPLKMFAERSRAAMLNTKQSAASALVELIYSAEVGSVSDIVTAYGIIRSLDQHEQSIHDRCLLLRCVAHALRIAGIIEEATSTAVASFRLAEEYGLHFGARLSAELLCNMLLDFERQEDARIWLATLSKYTESASHGNTQTSYEHTRDRFHLVEGTLRVSSADIHRRIERIRSFGNTHGKSSELALASVGLAIAGEVEAARSALNDATANAAAFAGRPVADFSIDACLIAGRLIGEMALAEELAVRHLTKRAVRRDLPLAPGFRDLRRLAASLATTQGSKLSGVP